jgi:CheY-like chemotaxis protein
MKKVLIVEDDAIFLNFVKEALKVYSDKFQVLTAENGKKAKEIIMKESIDLMLTDIMMPEVDGLALLAFLNDRQIPIPCFVMSAFGTPEIKKLIPKDVLQFFDKPFPVDKLGPIIVNALEEGVPKGVISGISVASFLMLVELDKKTCLFEIQLPDGTKGLCYFQKGVIFNAAYEGLRGEEAVLALLQKEKAKFSFKPLPEQKLGRMIESDLTTLISEAKSQTPPDLDKTMEVKYKDLQIESDGDPEPGDYPEHRLDIAGSYLNRENETGGRMTVINMSSNHLVFVQTEPRTLPVGTELVLNFTLDDKRKSQVEKEVTIVETRGHYVRCKFPRAEHYDRLGPYLHFNFLDKQTISHL